LTASQIVYFRMILTDRLLDFPPNFPEEAIE
jgi:hypothetical protein